MDGDQKIGCLVTFFCQDMCGWFQLYISFMRLSLDILSYHWSIYIEIILYRCFFLRISKLWIISLDSLFKIFDHQQRCIYYFQFYVSNQSALRRVCDIDCHGVLRQGLHKKKYYIAYVLTKRVIRAPDGRRHASP